MQNLQNKLLSLKIYVLEIRDFYYISILPPTTKPTKQKKKKRLSKSVNKISS